MVHPANNVNHAITANRSSPGVGTSPSSGGWVYRVGTCGARGTLRVLALSCVGARRMVGCQ